MGHGDYPNGNGAARGTERQPQQPRSLADHGRQIHHDAHALAAAVQDASTDAKRYLTEQVEQRPYGTLGVAAGIGYALGGGLRTRLTALMLGAATRLAMALAARQLGARFWQDGFRSSRTSAPENVLGAAKER